jgi:hypothetical protein
VEKMNIEELSVILKLSVKTIYNKLNKKTDFTLNELLKLQNYYYSLYSEKITLDEVVYILNEIATSIRKKERIKNEKNEHESN